MSRERFWRDVPMAVQNTQQSDSIVRCTVDDEIGRDDHNANVRAIVWLYASGEGRLAVRLGDGSCW